LILNLDVPDPEPDKKSILEPEPSIVHICALSPIIKESVHFKPDETSFPLVSASHLGITFSAVVFSLV
jgi:hypothetical protein